LPEPDDEAQRKAWAYREARRHARAGTDMAVGLETNDVTGEREWGFCPLVAVGPAFVDDIKDVILGRRR
jgi:hypothetical protein